MNVPDHVLYTLNNVVTRVVSIKSEFQHYSVSARCEEPVNAYRSSSWI
jgi:hypothetical protein